MSNTSTKDLPLDERFTDEVLTFLKDVRVGKMKEGFWSANLSLLSLSFFLFSGFCLFKYVRRSFGSLRVDVSSLRAFRRCCQESQTPVNLTDYNRCLRRQ